MFTDQIQKNHKSILLSNTTIYLLSKILTSIVWIYEGKIYHSDIVELPSMLDN